MVKEFDEYLRCGILAHGFLRAQCQSCQFEHLIAFSCKRRGFCTSCKEFLWNQVRINHHCSRRRSKGHQKNLRAYGAAIDRTSAYVRSWTTVLRSGQHPNSLVEQRLNFFWFLFSNLRPKLVRSCECWIANSSEFHILVWEYQLSFHLSLGCPGSVAPLDKKKY